MLSNLDGRLPVSTEPVDNAQPLAIASHIDIATTCFWRQLPGSFDFDSRVLPVESSCNISVSFVFGNIGLDISFICAILKAGVSVINFELAVYYSLTLIRVAGLPATIDRSLTGSTTTEPAAITH